jgi:hypothetical protein
MNIAPHERLQDCKKYLLSYLHVTEAAYVRSSCLDWWRASRQDYYSCRTKRSVCYCTVYVFSYRQVSSLAPYVAQGHRSYEVATIKASKPAQLVPRVSQRISWLCQLNRATNSTCLWRYHLQATAFLITLNSGQMDNLCGRHALNICGRKPGAPLGFLQKICQLPFSHLTGMQPSLHS